MPPRTDARLVWAFEGDTMQPTDLPPDEFAARRVRVFERIGDASALLQGAGPVRAFDRFRQSNEFHYLSGVEEPQAYVLLDGSTRETTLFLPRREAGQASHDEPTLSTLEDSAVRELTGVEHVCAWGELDGKLASTRVLYVPHQPAEGRLASRDVLLGGAKLAAMDPYESALGRESHFIGLLRARHPQIEIPDLSPILDELRLVKSAREVELIRRAAQLCGLGVMEAMRSTRPGVMEYQLGAVADLIFLAGGAGGSGYRAIIAGGENIWYPHYFTNDRPLRDGDLVLMDYAPDYGYYTCDIGRMWPVNGRYSDLQRELYGFMVAYHQALLQRLRPGVTAAHVMDEAAQEMADVVAATRFSKPVYEAAARRTLEFRGHLSHPVGMAVHDVGNYHAAPLVPGLTFTVDPQMWVPEERLYIRCEDTVAITDGGMENLTGFVPLELDATETLMREDGLLDRLPSAVLHPSPQPT